MTDTPLLTYRYSKQSALETVGDLANLSLETSGGTAGQGVLADGFAENGLTTARMLLSIADVAGTRFYSPPNMVAAAIRAADPVITAAKSGLRFESFSPCNSVYARFDLDARGFDGSISASGTTNVDVNQPLRAALSQIGRGDPLHLQVGSDRLVVRTLESEVVEKQVPLPERWVRGFAEVAVATSSLEPQATLSKRNLNQFFDDLPTSTTPGSMWVVPSVSRLRVTRKHSRGAVSATGVDRLRKVRGILPFVQSMTAFGQSGTRGPDEAASAWVFEVDGGRLTVAMSPAPSRGFSGEGGLLHALATSGEGNSSDIEAAGLGERGYDVARAEWFQRTLPFDRTALAKMGKRLSDARKLVHEDAVRSTSQGVTVTNKGRSYSVRRVKDEWRCTCPWWAKHRDSRGPCKHVLAVKLVEPKGL